MVQQVKRLLATPISPIGGAAGVLAPLPPMPLATTALWQAAEDSPNPGAPATHTGDPGGFLFLGVESIWGMNRRPFLSSSLPLPLCHIAFQINK